MFDAEPGSTAQRLQQVEIPLPLVPEPEVIADHEVFQAESLYQDGLHKSLRSHGRQLTVKPETKHVLHIMLSQQGEFFPQRCHPARSRGSIKVFPRVWFESYHETSHSMRTRALV